MVNIHEGKRECDNHLQSCFHPHELLIRDWPLSDACHAALYISEVLHLGLNFDPNLKANLKNNHEL